MVQTATPSTIELGPARISLLNLGELPADLAEWLGVPPADWGAHAPLFAQPVQVPVQSALIQLPAATVLVDACDPTSLAELGALPDAWQPPDVLTQLAARGLAPASITHVVVTHLHDDHFNGLARAQGGMLAPCFPNARHYIGHTDWQAAQARIAAPAAPADHVLAALAQHGLVEPVDRQIALTPELTVFATPGETPGHLALRLHTHGQSFYALGDLYHHAVEVERADWLVYWADRVATLGSRELIMPTALAENAVLMATHIPGFGRLRAVEGGLRWEVL